MTTTPDTVVLPVTPFSRTAILTAAETAFHLPTNMVDLLLATDNINGARIERGYAMPRAANAALNNIQLYERVGSTYTLIDSAQMAVLTPSATVASAKTDFGYSPDSPLELRLGVGLAAAMGQAIANGVVVRIHGGLY